MTTSFFSCISVDEMIAEVDIDGDGRIDYDGRWRFLNKIADDVLRYFFSLPCLLTVLMQFCCVGI